MTIETRSVNEVSDDAFVPAGPVPVDMGLDTRRGDPASAAAVVAPPPPWRRWGHDGGSGE